MGVASGKPPALKGERCPMWPYSEEEAEWLASGAGDGGQNRESRRPVKEEECIPC